MSSGISSCLRSSSAPAMSSAGNSTTKVTSNVHQAGLGNANHPSK
jgi:hypothetical protein